MTEVEKLRKQLAIAVKVLKHYENKKLCQKALRHIEDIESENNLKKVVDNNKCLDILES